MIKKMSKIHLKSGVFEVFVILMSFDIRNVCLVRVVTYVVITFDTLWRPLLYQNWQYNIFNLLRPFIEVFVRIE